ncbi:MAG: lamin tail domain-containing protein [Candidatus Kapaibacterium sp.]
MKCPHSSAPRLLLTVTAIALAAAVSVGAQLLITEVHPTPSSGEPEWVECVNTSSRPIRLDGWRVCDNRTCVVIPSMTLAAGGFLVLVRDAEALAEARFIPATTVIAECPVPSLNNSVDRVELRRADSSIVDSVTYDVRKNLRGVSIERCGVWQNGVVVYDDVWGPCMRRDSASCGSLNSCVRLPHDVRVLPATIEDSSVLISFMNVGSLPCEQRRLSIDCGDLRIRDVLPALDPQQADRVRIARNSVGLHDTVRTVTIRVVIAPVDDRPENDTLEQLLVIPTAEPRITITEMMAEPNERQSEYIEVWNGTPATIDLAGWMLEDASGKRGVIVPPARVESGGYMAVAADTSISRMAGSARWTLMRPAVNINSTTDTITLRTPQGLIVDRVPYDSRNHAQILTTRGIAVERRAPCSNNPMEGATWTSSTDVSGGTPGRRNSVGRPPPVISGMRSWPDPCSAVASSLRYPCMITWEQPLEQGIGRLRVFRADGIAVAELFNGRLIGNSGSAIWDVRDGTTGAPVPVGIYVAVLECTSIQSPEHRVDGCIINVGETDDVLRKR